MSEYIAHLSEINLESVLIKDEAGDVLINLADETVSGKLSMGIIDIVESIGSTSVIGELIVDSTRGEFEALQLIGNESVQFIFTSPSGNEDEEEVKVTSPDFRIYDYNDSSDFGDLSLTPEGFTSRSLTLKFSSKQEGDIFDTETPLPFGFIGKIAVDVSPTPVDEIVDPIEGPPEPPTEGEEGEEGEEDEETPDESCPGLINEIAAKYFSTDDFEIERTDNSVFISPHRFTYPSRKITRNMNLLQLIKYCTNYAWRSSNEGIVGPPAPGTVNETYSSFGWCNYFFWQDLFGWHFKSATKMVSDGEIKGIKTFSFSRDILSKNRIMTLDPISDFSIKKSFSSGMLYAYHTRVEPNYTDIYSKFLDDDQKYIKTNYVYNYATDYTGIVEPFKFLPSTLEDKPLVTWIEDKVNHELEIKDYLFGWYDNRQYNEDTQLDHIIGRGRDKGASGPLGSTGSDAIDLQDPMSLLELSDYNRYQDNIWQEMFDCVQVGDPAEINADCMNLKKITQIKADTFNAKNRYKQAMNYKEKWNLYRYSVCCEVPESDTSTTFAILKGHQKIADTTNIFEYDWAEVCIIPKAAIGFVVGHKIEDYNGINPWDNTLVGDSGLNALALFDKTTTGVAEIYPYVSGAADPSDSTPVGYLSGIVNFITQTPGGTAEGVTGSISWDHVKELFDESGGVPSEGLTLTFHNSQYSPFLVVEKPNGGSGIISSRRAYNLNEIMNRPILDEDDYPTVEGACADMSVGTRSTIFWQESPIELAGNFNANPFEVNPNLDNIQYMVGPGINASQGDNWTDYPQAFDTMPIGSYKTVVRNTNGGYVGGLDCEAIPIGHVVKLEFSSFDEIYKLGIEGRHADDESSIWPKGPKGIYYFSAENAHDGKCEGNNCTL